MLKEVTFVRFFLTSLEIKLAKELKNKGFKIYCITFYRIDKGYDGIFDKEYYIRNERYENLSGVGGAVIKKNLKSFNFYKALPGFYRRIRKMNDSIVIGVGEPNFFVTMIFKILRKKAVLKLFFPYDVTYLRYTDYKKNAWYDRRPEKKLFNMADGIIHKGRIDELELLPMEFNATNKPSIQFLAYCDEDDMLQIKNTKKQGEIHLVYAGVAIHELINVLEMTERISKGNIFHEIQCGRTDEELLLMKKWDQTHKTILSPDDWLKLFKDNDYVCDYHFKVLMPIKELK